MEHKEHRHYDSREKEKYERKLAWKNFKKLRQQLVDEYLAKDPINAKTKITEIAKLQVPYASITKACLKANDDSDLIRKIVRRNAEDEPVHSKILDRLEILSIFENKGYEISAANNSTTKTLKTTENYTELIGKGNPWKIISCKKCDVPFYYRSGVNYGRNRYRRYQLFWKNEKKIHHWLEHIDAELAQIYAKNGINGIVELDEKRVEDFFRHLKIFLGRRNC